MFLRNTSRYDDAEIRRIVEFAARDFDLRGVCVNVRNCTYARAGRAYQSVPYCSNAPRTAKRLVVLRIGAPEKYPTSNHTSGRPYGGKDSPAMEFADWREGLVSLAAHEFNHIRQFQNRSTCSESRCEKAALRVLGAWRAQQVPA